MVGEYGRGELCGIVETLTGAKRSTTLLAVRDTEIAKIPSGLINSIKLKFPRVVSKLINLLGKKLLRLQKQPTLSQTGEIFRNRNLLQKVISLSEKTKKLIFMLVCS